MKYEGKTVKIGDVVEVDGEKRIITRITGDAFNSMPYTEDEAKIELTAVEIPEEKPEEVSEEVPEEKPAVVEKKIRRRGKSK